MVMYLKRAYFERLKVWNQYEITTDEYENKLIVFISEMVCFVCGIINYLFFTLLDYGKNGSTIIRSIILFGFGFGYLLVDKANVSANSKKYSLNFLTVLITLFLVIAYYPIIGPTVWTYSFLILIISMIRSNFKMLILLSVVLSLSGLYTTIFHVDFPIDNKYYYAQFVAFTFLVLACGVIYLNNQRKNKVIEKQFKELQSLTNQLELVNQSLKEEIENHQNTIKELYLNEKKFKSIVHANPDVVFLMNNEGILLDCEAGDYSWLLYPKSVFIGNSIDNFLPEEVTEQMLLKIQETLESGQTQKLDYELLISDQNKYYEARFIKNSDTDVYAILRDTTEEKNKQKMIEYLSFHDQLTGLYNRRFYAEEILRLDQNRNLPLSLAMLDINGLKLTNDAFGHLVGDELLISVANTLKNECRADDIIARIGGDEFVIIFPRTDEEAVECITQRIYKAVEECSLKEVVVSVSVGWATKHNSEEDIQDILKKAEERMYRKKMTESQSMRNKTVMIILKTLNEKNERERKHSERVSLICEKIGVALGCGSQTINDLKIAGLMHDIGKISVPEIILNKEGKLDTTEYELIKNHSESGYHILKSVDLYSALAEDILLHHEFYNGAGYPKGLKGEEIPMISRIIAIADAFEAMTSDRTYRKAMSTEEAIEELKRNAGTQFDPIILEKTLQVLENL